VVITGPHGLEKETKQTFKKLQHTFKSQNKSLGQTFNNQKKNFRKTKETFKN